MTGIFPEIEALIRHRAPVLCIDEIIVCSESDAECALAVCDGPLVQDGFLWEPALIEVVAQTAAVMGGYRLQKIGSRIERGWFVSARDFLIHRTPRVGERITCHVHLIRRLNQLVLIEGSVSCGDHVLAEGQLIFHEVVSR